MKDHKGLSSRVLEMKFMQVAGEREGREKKEEQKKKLRDLSEWKLPNADSVVDRIRHRKQKIETVGYSSIGSICTGRRNFGLKEAVKVEEGKGEGSGEDEKDKQKDTALLDTFKTWAEGKGSQNGVTKPKKSTKRHISKEKVKKVGDELDKI
ncbi:DEKNAAC103116 [Brettanomyces naardenensis]|uniref:DEKNAAC103116 n=1 Tax=Brettanomyces naardenensis TaxID=13370 RepID=A0A448YMM2_BRENA|nr:DEKNAAC103116 [Brettanomyces naardenensis]